MLRRHPAKELNQVSAVSVREEACSNVKRHDNEIGYNDSLAALNKNTA